MAKKETALLSGYIERVYSDQELKDFDISLDKYKRWVEVKGRKVFALMKEGELMFLTDEGAMTKDFSIKISGMTYDKDGTLVSYDHPRCEVLMGKLRQRVNWKGRQEYGERQKLLQLQALN